MTDNTVTNTNTSASAACSICHEVPEEGKRATVPGCGHSFCAGCIVSWAAVRGACALCRAPFESLLVSRTLDGEPRCAPALEPVTLLRRVSWIETVAFEPDLDVFAPPPADIPQSLPHPSPTTRALASATSSAPYYQDERVEDELEDLFWAEEEKAYREFSRRTVGNRPFGANGFLASGRRSARPVQVTRRQRAAAAAAAAASSSAATSASSSAAGPPSSPRQPPARRKKKVKKNSRAGKEAAAAAARAAAAASSSSASASSSIQPAAATRRNTTAAS